MNIGSQDQGVYTVASHNDFALESTWTRDGKIVPINDWTSYIEPGTKNTVTVSGDYNDPTTLTVTLHTGYDDVLTFAGIDNESQTCTSLKVNGTEADNSWMYLTVGDAYDWAGTASSAYVSSDELTGYVTLQGWYYGTSVYDYGYIDIEWYTNIADDTYAIAQISTSKTSATGTYYATYCAPFQTSLSSYGKTYAQAYTIDGTEENGTTLTMTEITDVIPANTPVVLATTQVYSSCKAGVVEEASSLTKGLLTGVLEDTEVAATGEYGTNYVLQNHNGYYDFYAIADTKTVPANHAYLTYQTAPDVKELYLTSNGSATAIQTVNALTSGKAQIYDLNGRQLQKLQKGVNIVNGVKVLVK